MAETDISNSRKIVNEYRAQLQSIGMSKLKVKIDKYTLDQIIRFLYKESNLRTHKALLMIEKFIDNLDLSIYKSEDEGSQESLNRIWVIKKTLDGYIHRGYESFESLRAYCMESVDCDRHKEMIIEQVVDRGTINYNESKQLLEMISDRIKFGYTVTLKKIIKEAFNQMDQTDYRSYKYLKDLINDIGVAIVSINRKASTIDATHEFSLLDSIFETVVTDALEKLKNRNRIFVTGIRLLNSFLAPGYMSKRLYTYLALPGNGKSQILLKSALDIRKYNKGVKCKNPEKRPAVLFITMENTIEETVERIFNMVAENDDIRNYTTKQVIRKLKEMGELTLTDENNIDIIIRYYRNREIDTNDLYGIIQDLSDDGIEVIALILDYLKRIKPAEKGQNEKEELKNITNELKDLAIFFDIPVITAQQLNRNAATVVDSALQAKKSDVTKLVGRDGVAGAWEIVENSDVVIVINQEKKAETNQPFMTFKLLKRRYRSNDDDDKMRDIEYFNHPYAEDNSIRLIDDVNQEESVSLISLASDFLPMEDSRRGKKNVIARKEAKKKDEEDDDDNILGDASFDAFDMGTAFYTDQKAV